MNGDITRWVRTCLPCQRGKIQRHTKNAPERIPIPDTRFHHVHIDIVGPLPLSRGYRYCLTMIDRFTRWPEAIPIADMSADSVTKAFFSGWVARFGAPAIVTTDRGSQFESIFFQALTKLLGCQRTRTAAYHPASNGMIERWHRLRTSFKEDLRATAAELVYGTTLRLPGEYFLSDEPANDPQIFLEPFRERIRRVRSAPAAHHSKARAFAHRTLHFCTHVFVRVGGSLGPLCQPYEGPFEVLERISDTVFRVNVNGKPSTISTERLKPAFFEATEQTDITPTMEDNNDSQSPISNQPKTYLPRKRIRFTISASLSRSGWSTVVACCR
ncbi:uncharacterized protein LOC122523340 [Polistes fuscatus]|uniref:uncharacterized protein LOC122523340 n=1 Tax=Polistes fuscatus TaxID=30207 RepID=UPI001CA9244E|nr:uncharacterized protein LOC122523340 [Polistes fuscatus]